MSHCACGREGCQGHGPELAFLKAASRAAGDIHRMALWKAGNAASRKIVERAFWKFQSRMALEIIRGFRRGSKGQNPDQLTDNLVDWEKLREAGIAIFQPVFQDIVERTEAEKPITMAKVQNLPKVAPQTMGAMNWSILHTGDLITEITENQKSSIRGVTRSAIWNGGASNKLSRDIRPMIGLHSKQVAALEKYKTRLLAEGLPAAKIDALVAKKSQQALKYRAEMIARTETSMARVEGVFQRNVKMGIKKFRFLADPECCGECSAKSGKVYSAEQAAGMIPVHPQCECTWVAATPADLEIPTSTWPFVGEPPAMGGISIPDIIGTKVPKIPKKPAVTEPEKPFVPKNLTENENAAIEEWTGSGYRNIRLGWNDPSVIPYADSREDAIMGKKYLQKLFSKFGNNQGARDNTLYRGLTIKRENAKIWDEIAKWKQGAVHKIDMAPQSWSTDPSVAQGFMYGNEGGRIRFELKAGRKMTTELDLSKAFNQSEKEVLMQNTEFRVVEIHKYEDVGLPRRLEIVLEEVMGKAKFSATEIALALAGSPDWKTERQRRKKERLHKKRQREIIRGRK
jgi:SPP1 gp7 family putative phage head morphogenesis protein